MYPNTHSATLRNKLYEWQTKVDVYKIFKKHVVFHEIYETDNFNEDEPLSIKARNDLGMNEF